jgi:hypothetical protein
MTRRRLLITTLVAAAVFAFWFFLVRSDRRIVGTWAAEGDPYRPSPIVFDAYGTATERDKFSGAEQKYQWWAEGEQIVLQRIHMRGAPAFHDVKTRFGYTYAKLAGTRFSKAYFRFVDLVKTEDGELRISIRDERIGHTYLYRRRQ